MKPGILNALRAARAGQPPIPSAVPPPTDGLTLLHEQLLASIHEQGRGISPRPAEVERSKLSGARRRQVGQVGRAMTTGTIEEALGEAPRDPRGMDEGEEGVQEGKEKEEERPLKENQHRSSMYVLVRTALIARGEQERVEAALRKEAEGVLRLPLEEVSDAVVAAHVGMGLPAGNGNGVLDRGIDGVAAAGDSTCASSAATGTPSDLPDLEALPPFSFVCGMAGCLAGQTTVEYRRGLRTGSRSLTLQELYTRFNGIDVKWRDLTMPTFLHSLGENGVMFYNRVVAVYESGIKALVRVELSGERYLRATPDHPILTANGFVHAGDLASGQSVICRGSMLAQPHGGRDLSARPPRVLVTTRFHPYGAYKCVEGQYEYMRVHRSRLVVEAALNDLSYEEYLHILKHNEGVAAELRYIPTDFEVHHEDEDTLNDDLGNLLVLTKAEHARLHNQRGNFQFDSVRGIFVKAVVAVEEEMTYDVQMESPANNFCANGIVVHNTGKTFQAKTWAAANPEGVILAATTGIAAVNLGEGTTINALLRYYDTASLRDAYTGGWLESHFKRLRGAGLQRLILDETSMLSGDQLTVLCRAIDNVNADRTPDDPEMGLILIGDFAQLPPVKEPFAFESAEWGRFAATTMKLTTIHRQTDQDFVRALHAVRRGDARSALDFFAPRLEQTTDQAYNGTTILAKNEAVDKYNQLRLDKVKGAPLDFPSSRWGKVRAEWGGPPKPPREWGIPETLHLKEGALVMVLANRNIAQKDDPPEYLYVNGDLGRIEGVERGAAQVTLQRTGEMVPVVPIVRENGIPLEPGRRKALREEGHPERISTNGKQEVVGAITYMPLRLAWGSTVHKSQGLTLDQVQVNVRDHFFTSPSMLYVALSRARTAEGLRIVGSAEGFRTRCTVNAKVKLWL